jgi:hypothetical protein
MESVFKVEKVLAFLPNTQFNPNDFQQGQSSTDEALSTFKKKYNYLNHFNDS